MKNFTLPEGAVMAEFVVVPPFKAHKQPDHASRRVRILSRVRVTGEQNYICQFSDTDAGSTCDDWQPLPEHTALAELIRHFAVKQ